MSGMKAKYKVKNSDGSYSIRWFETLGEQVIFNDNSNAELKKKLWDSYGTIITLSHSKIETTHLLTVLTQNVPSNYISPYIFCQFKATDNFTNGDQIKIESDTFGTHVLNPITQNGEPILEDIFKNEDFVICVINISDSSIIFFTFGGSGSGIGGNVSTADKLPGSSSDEQASTGKSIESIVPESTAADTKLTEFDLGKISLLGRYSISIRLKCNYQSKETTNLIKVELIRKRNEEETVLNTGFIRECDIYTISDYCTFAMAVEINDKLQNDDKYIVRFKTGGSSHAFNLYFDYVYASIAGATIFSI